MTQSSRWIYATTFVLVGAGFLLPLWPLCVVGIALCALSGRVVFAVVVALILDFAWGAPSGALHYLYLPFTALALAGALAHHWGSRYFLDKSLQQKI